MDDLHHDVVDAFAEFYRNYYRDDIGNLAQHYPQEQTSLWIDADDLYRFDQTLLEDWRAQPATMQRHAELALENFDLPLDIDLSSATVRLTDETETIPRQSVTDLTSDDIGDYVAVSGQLGKITGKSPRLVGAIYECQRCGRTTEMPQTRTEVNEPHECAGCERQGPFQLRPENSKWVDQRKIKLEEPIQERSQARGESTPVYVEGGLCDHGQGESELPDHSGEQATICGVVNVDESQLTGRSSDPETDLWIDAQAIVFEDGGHADVDIEAHRDTFEQLAAREDAVDIVAESLAPSLQASEGDDLYTARRAAAAWLFNAYRMDPDESGSKRGDLHMCLIGDPGTGKSSLMGYLHKVAPKSEFRSGTGLSEVGLTAAAVQEEFAGTTEWTLQPGILPRADGGHCLIDEIDGVVDDNTKAIHDALEGEQMVKTDKAGIKADLPTRTALLVGGNPTYTRFNRHEPIPQQIDIDPALFDRMDLVFALMDEVDAERDAEKATHALDAYDDLSRAEVAQRNGQDAETNGVADPEVPADVLRAWVAYARENVFPLLSEQAKADLKEFYVDVRDLNDGHTDDGADDPVPATMRTLEAGVRLSIALARLRLSETVEQCDVKRAISLTRNVVGLNFDPDSGQFDADRHTRTITSQQERRETLYNIINDADGAVSVKAIRARADEAGIDTNTVESDIDHFMKSGDLYEPQTDHYDTT
jgi:replicative DNA helicase Mcm